MITSKQNSLIKQIRSLSDKKFRDKLNLYLIEGVKLVREAISLSLPIFAIVGTEKALKEIDCKNYRYETVTDEVFSFITTEVSPQGVVAVIEKPSNELCAPNGSCVLLDGVSDPTNVGAIIRTATASGYNNVYLTNDCADQFSPKAVRASMSGVFRINSARGSAEELLKAINLPVVVADMKGENLFNHNIKGDFCLVIGNEGHGVSEFIRKSANYTLSIPMQNGMESLNAAVSASLMMYGLKNS